LSNTATIVQRVHEAKGDSIVADKIIMDYLPFIKSETSKIIGRVVVEGRDDELSVAMIAFHEAIESYSQIRGAFLNYAKLLIKRKLIDYYRKEKRHLGHFSLDTELNENEKLTLGDTIAEDSDNFGELDIRDATRDEILELTNQLATFDVSLTDIADNCPKQVRTLAACQSSLKFACENPDLIDELKRTKRLPIAKLSEGSGTDKKTLERHRKYMLALLIIYSNGYEIIRGHLKQVYSRTKGGAEK